MPGFNAVLPSTTTAVPTLDTSSLLLLCGLLACCGVVLGFTKR